MSVQKLIRKINAVQNIIGGRLWVVIRVRRRTLRLRA